MGVRLDNNISENKIVTYCNTTGRFISIAEKSGFKQLLLFNNLKNEN